MKKLPTNSKEMEEQHDLAKWLAGEMNETELLAFKKTEAYATYDKIAKYSTQFETPAFDEEKMYHNVISREKAGRKVVPLHRSILFKIAAALVIALAVTLVFNPFGVEKHYADNGKETTFLLPDDSQVVLNSGSEINYKKWNWDNNRSLDLKGEAFFKVAKGKTFDVNTTLGKVTVVGTEFNVKSRNARFEVECFEGKVKVQFDNKEVFLTKGQILVAENGSVISAMPTNAGQPCWMDNEICFNSVPLSDIISELERSYDISITQKNIASDQKFTGRIPADNLQKGLTIISKTYNLKFEIAKNSVVLSPDE